MAQKPIGYYGEFRPTGVDQSAARRFEALAGLANQVGDIAYQIGAKKAEQVGAEKGEKAGREYAAKLAKPQPKVGPPEEMAPPETKKGFLASMSIEAQAYNAAMKSAYLSQVSTDAKEQIERIAAQYPNDVQAFKSNIGQYTQGLLQGVGDEYREAAEATVNNYVANAETAVFKNEIATNRAQANASRQLAINLHNDESAKMARDGDPDQAIVNQQHHDLVIDSMVASGDLAADDAQIAKDSLAKRIQQQTQLGELERVIFDENLSTREQYEKGVAFVERIRDADLTDIGPEDKDKLISILDAKVESLGVNLAKEESQISSSVARRIVDIKVAANTGSMSKEEVIEKAWNLYDEAPKFFTENEVASVITAVSKKSQAEINKAQSMLTVGQSLQGNVNVFPTQKDVDTYYIENKSNFDDSPNKAAAQAQFIESTRQVPTAIKNEVNRALYSPDLNIVSEAIDLIERVDSIPGNIEIVTPNDRAFAVQLSNLAEVMTLKEAAVQARKMTDPRNQERIAAAKETIKEEDYSDKYGKWTESALGDLEDSPNKSRAIARYKDIFETYYVNGMSEDQARTATDKVMVTNWKESPDFGFMQYTPEDYYAVNGNTQYIKDQLYADVTKRYVYPDPIRKENMFLVPDDHTARTANLGQPEYLVMVRTKNGELEILRDEAGDIYWTPDMGLEKEVQQDIIAGKYKRARSLKQKATSEERKLAAMLGGYTPQSISSTVDVITDVAPSPDDSVILSAASSVLGR